MLRTENIAFKKFNGWARTLYHASPLGLIWVLSPLVYCVRKFRQLRVELWIVQGQERSSCKPLTILCATQDRNRDYLAELAFGPTYWEQYLGQAWLWNATRVAGKMGGAYSIMFIEVHKSLRRLIGQDNWFYVPDWVIGTIDFPLESNIAKSESVKSDLRRIRKHELRFVITHELQHFDNFYHNMYVPYIVKAHRSAYITPYEQMRNRYKNCELLLVKKQKRYIAGILISYSKAGPRLWSLGILHGNLEHLREGAGAALYHFALRHLEEKDFPRVITGLSRAFLRDGVLGYKKKLSQRITGMSSNMFALQILSFTAATRAFLANNPFIFEDRGFTNGAVFLDTKKPLSAKEFEKIDKEYFYPGLCKMFVYFFERSGMPNPNVVPPEIFERIVLQPAEKIADRHDHAG